MRGLFRRRVEYVTVREPVEGIILRGIGTTYPSLHNNTPDPVRITFTLAGSSETRSVDVAPRERAAFHTNDGKFRADFIEIAKETDGS